LTIDGGGQPITTGIKGYVTVPYACTIAGYSIQADQPGSIVLDIWKAAGVIPTVANSITASAKPALSSAQLIQSTTLTGWTTNISANDVVGFNVDSASTIQRVTLVLNCQK